MLTRYPSLNQVTARGGERRTMQGNFGLVSSAKGNLKLSGLPSDQGTSGEARTHDRRFLQVSGRVRYPL
ncbi:hypothetical protein PoB_002294600 [Plakobranchus ocellatus]|uniref:Uncharacterized protein n=1 Tax=Plakobranchus ocellatus TaxID=259542 RepID=A0AAV3ZAZ5_9GAST|nr:hypothetical protein PoB_002294600 [Plakobranchus ocellatus]